MKEIHIDLIFLRNQRRLRLKIINLSIVMDGNLIFEIEDVIPPELCNEIISKFEKCDYKKVSKINNDDSDNGFISLRDRNSQEIDIDYLDSDKRKNWEDIDLKLREALNKGLNEYFDTLSHKIKSSINEDPSYLIPQIMCKGVQSASFAIQRVEKNSWFRWHHDAQLHDVSKHARLFTCIFYLNTMKEESGGRTEFLSGRKVLPKAGKLLIFPATWSNIHCGSWVKDEHKYICTIGVYVNV